MSQFSRLTTYQARPSQQVNLVLPGTGRVLQTYAYDSEDLSLPLRLTAAAPRSRLLGQAFPAQLKRWITEENLTSNLHHDGVAPEDMGPS